MNENIINKPLGNTIAGKLPADSSNKGSLDKGSTAVMPTYGRKNVSFTSGQGIWLKDDEGNTYMDMVSGVAVNCLGHCSPVMIEALTKQANQVIHISNLYWNEPQKQLAEKLIALSDGVLQDVFFCNSGTEALEGALKLCKKYGKANGKQYLVYMNNSFHGRTNGALSITGQEKYQTPFGGLLPDCIAIDFNDMEGLNNLFALHGDNIAAVFAEPIQGEGGIIEMDPEYGKLLRSLCNTHGALLVLDEVQCGAGRMGTYYGYQSMGIKPDILCMAKGLGGGVPIGALLANEKASVFQKGDHGSTYGGNPLMCGVASAVTEVISQEDFLKDVQVKSLQLTQGLKKLVEQGKIESYRGKGLLLGMVVEEPTKWVDLAFENKLLLISAGSDTIRLLPPLNITSEEIDALLEKLDILFDVSQ